MDKFYLIQDYLLFYSRPLSVLIGGPWNAPSNQFTFARFTGFYLFFTGALMNSHEYTINRYLRFEDQRKQNLDSVSKLLFDFFHISRTHSVILCKKVSLRQCWIPNSFYRRLKITTHFIYELKFNFFRNF